MKNGSNKEEEVRVTQVGADEFKNEFKNDKMNLKIKQINNDNHECPSMIICLQFARRWYHPDFSDILNLCEGCFNPLDKEKLKNVCRGKNYG